MKNNKNSRLFSKRNNEYMNPSIGTWVNIEESENNEFILVTHSAKARKGCLDLYSYETRYTSSKLKSGKIEQILFNQCYNFANWEGSIKLPNVLHYAEKCAKFNGEVLRSKEVNENMENSLYYI